MTADVSLTKLHGLGNDFLVLLPDDGAMPADAAALARRVCDRHLGIGADGLLIGIAGDDPRSWQMVLYNADGSRAEMSGNGIRCFVHAVVRAESLDLPGEVRVATDGGERVVAVETDPEGAEHRVQAAVHMGEPTPGPELDDAATPGRSATWNLGNPHLVLEVDDPAAIDLATEGPRWEDRFEGGMNVHFIRVDDRAHLTQATWERGAGITLACGTGATAAALSAHDWGLVDDRVTVTMPGGQVHLDCADAPVLRGPSEWIADCRVSA